MWMRKMRIFPILERTKCRICPTPSLFKLNLFYLLKIISFIVSRILKHISSPRRTHTSSKRGMRKKKNTTKPKIADSRKHQYIIELIDTRMWDKVALGKHFRWVQQCNALNPSFQSCRKNKQSKFLKELSPLFNFITSGNVNKGHADTGKHKIIGNRSTLLGRGKEYFDYLNIFF